MGCHCFVLCLQMSFAPGKKFPSIASLLRFFFPWKMVEFVTCFFYLFRHDFSTQSIILLSVLLIWCLIFYWQAKFAFLGQNPLKIVSFPIYYTIPVGNTVLLKTFPPVFKRRYWPGVPFFWYFVWFRYKDTDNVKSWVGRYSFHQIAERLL